MSCGEDKACVLVLKYLPVLVTTEHENWTSEGREQPSLLQSGTRL